MIFGASGTFQRYPVIAFSGEDRLGQDVVTILLGEDDNGFGILVLYRCRPPQEINRQVLYLPRSEVKWISIVQQAPLQLYAHLYELYKGNRTGCPVQGSSPPPSPSPPASGSAPSNPKK
jgi:hypothetical protein